MQFISPVEQTKDAMVSADVASDTSTGIIKYLSKSIFVMFWKSDSNRIK